MKLQPMTEGEFKFWSTRSKVQYAEDKRRANDLTENEAVNIAEQDFLRLLPDGFKSKNSLLFSMKTDVEKPVGYLWIGIRGAENNRKAFIYDIIVEEEARGKGFGRKAMIFAEEEAKKLGLKEIGLHVFGFNRTAINLYESLGYETTDLVMAKKI